MDLRDLRIKTQRILETEVQGQRLHKHVSWGWVYWEGRDINLSLWVYPSSWFLPLYPGEEEESAGSTQAHIDQGDKHASSSQPSSASPFLL